MSSSDLPGNVCLMGKHLFPYHGRISRKYSRSVLLVTVSRCFYWIKRKNNKIKGINWSTIILCIKSCIKLYMYMIVYPQFFLLFCFLRFFSFFFSFYSLLVHDWSTNDYIPFESWYTYITYLNSFLISFPSVHSTCLALSISSPFKKRSISPLSILSFIFIIIYILGFLYNSNHEIFELVHLIRFT